MDNRWIIIREFADDVDISFGSCQAIFTDVLSIKSAAARIVLKLLNFEQKQQSVGLWLRLKPKAQFIPMEASRRAKTENNKKSKQELLAIPKSEFRV